MKNGRLRALTLASVGCAVLSGALVTAQGADQTAKFATPTRISAGDAFLGEGRLYPSPVLHDVDGDGIRDVVIGDLIGKVTYARATETQSGVVFGAEKPLKDRAGEQLRFHNWWCIGMGSQFVDFNADGHLDYLSATFDGSPHIAYGSADGFAEPVRLVDANGERILINYYWDYDEKKHLVTHRAMPDDKTPKERCISALAFDWDADGDFDLLLGSYENGHLYRQMNEGTNAAPKFTGVNIAVMAGAQAFALPAKMTAPRLVDWDADGDLDLIAGSFGDCYTEVGKGGGVYLSRNTGSAGAPKFGALETLIAPGPDKQTEPTYPRAGLYADAVDYDGDGDLDLVVGGYSMWTPPRRDLTDEEEAEVARMRTEQKQVRAEQAEFSRRLSVATTEATTEATKGLDQSGAEAREKTKAVLAKHRKESAAVNKRVRAITEQLNELVPGPKRKTFVWLYERL